MEDFAAPAFGVSECNTISGDFADVLTNRSARQFRQNLTNNAARLENFFTPHDHAPLHIALAEYRHAKLNLVVEIVREIAPQVAVDSRCARGDANDSEIARHLRAQHPSCFEPIARAGGGAK